MVQLHCELAEVLYTRATHDVDIVVDPGSGTTLSSMGARLQARGYLLTVSIRHDGKAHRFVHPDGLQVDVLAKDDSRNHRLFSYPAVQAPGSKSALGKFRDGRSKERETVDLGDGLSVSIPNIWSAISLKGWACRTSNSDRERHIQDAIALLSCAGKRGERRALTKSERRAVNIVLSSSALGDHLNWMYLSDKAWADVITAIKMLRPELQQISLPKAVQLRCDIK